MIITNINNQVSRKNIMQALADGNKKVYMCIGTEKVFADSLGPRVGSLLNGNMQLPLVVYGMCGSNITAENLLYSVEFIRKMHPSETLVVIDAAVGARQQLGEVQVARGGIIPGAATNKNLPEVGDISIIGIVAERGMADFYTSNSEKDAFVNRVAEYIANMILESEVNSQVKCVEK